MKLRYPLLSLLGLGSYVAHAQHALPPATWSEPVGAPALRALPGTHLYSSFEEPTEDVISGTHLEPVPSAAHARTGQSSLLLAGGRGNDKAYFSLSHLLPVKAGQAVKASLYASYTAPSHTVDRVLQAAGMAAAAYSQSPSVTPALPEQATGKRAIPYLGIGFALTPTVKSWRRATPKAYLRYSVYNADTVLVASDTRPVDRTARDNWQELSFAKTMPVDGFVQLTFVNESPQPVRVDDLALLIDAGTPAPARKLKGAIANDLGVQYSGNCQPWTIPLPELPITSPPPPSDPYPYIPPGYFPGDNYPPSDPNPLPDPAPGYPVYNPDGPASIAGIIIKNSVHNDPKAECLLSKLLNNAQFQNLLVPFATSIKYNVSYELGSPSGTGNCRWDNTTSTAVITINQKDLDYQHAIWGATTFFHETYHAELQQYAIETFGTLVIGSWPKPINDLTLQELIGCVDATASANAQWSNATHAYMAFNNDVMAEGLRSFVQANFPDTYKAIGSSIDKYNYLSLMGLEGTTRFTDEFNTPDKVKAYHDILDEFVTGEHVDCL